MVWGTPRCVRAIHVVAQHFCEAHDSNQATPKSTSVTQSKTPTNAPRSVSLNKINPQNVRAKELSDVALSAVKGGSSAKDLDELIKQLADIKKLE
ncbi:hypothetical protein CFP56_000567 [Quercus suber]|uniref:Uncharacterized protein n=1 Tax=Quercus suber TaxID=58331 RepID=A0AAW0IP57_QUESU